LLVAVIGAPLMIVAVVALAATPAAARFEDPDLDTSATYTYEILPDEGRVRVTIDLAVAHVKPNQAVDASTYRAFYFDGFAMIVPGGASDLVVVDGAGQTLETTATPEQDASLIEIRFARNLEYRQTMNLTISFALNGALPRSADPARVNPAYAGFPVWLSANIEQADLAIIAPEGFVYSGTGDTPFTEVFEVGESVYRLDDVDPELFFTFASFTNDEALQERGLTVDGIELVLRYWPGDEVWADHTAEALDRGLAVLVERVGQPWPVGGSVTIEESYGPAVHGYAGWYDSRLDAIEVGDTLDDHVVYHELTHTWFHGDEFAERWVYEGLCQLYAAEVVEALDGTRPRPDPVEPPSPDNPPLSAWNELTRSPERELWGYNASWEVMEAIGDEIGLDALAGVIDAVVNGRAAYPGDDPEEDETAVDLDDLTDWRRLLDLIENRADVEGTTVSDLFTEWVLVPGEDLLVQRRTPSRQRYAELVEAGDGWAAPDGVRSQMSEWRFDDADALMAAAAEVLETRDELVAIVEPVGVDLPPELEHAYEQSEDSFDEIEAELDQATAAAEALRQAHDDLGGPSSLVEWVGMIGWDQGDELDAAATAFERGQLAAATMEARRAQAVTDGAARRGWIVIGSAAGVLVLVALAVGTLLLRRGRRPNPAR
jgi:hypothetical protein